VAEFFSAYGLFLAQAITVVVAVLGVVGGVLIISMRSRPEGGEHIEIKHLNRKFEEMENVLQAAMLPKAALKKRTKEQKKRRKTEEKQGETAEAEKSKRVFVLDFHGDIRASAVSALREEISAVLTVARPQDEVLVRIESSGGLVHGYGLAASQLVRVKEKGIPLTVAVDKAAASGGYMMACVADQIIAAPFAVLGSIGVLAQLPNFHRLLEKNDIDFEQFMAGEHKRTVTVFGKNTEEGKEKFRQELEDLHGLFKDFVREHRAQLDIEKVSTGEHWFGKQALTLGLVDGLRTSDDYLMCARETAELYEVHYFSEKKPLLARLANLTEGRGVRGDLGHPVLSQPTLQR